MQCIYYIILFNSRAMSSFLATDLNGDHLIQVNELRTLLWLTEGIEPTNKRIQAELKAMDINSDGNISMIDWITYLASVDPIVIVPLVTI